MKALFVFTPPESKRLIAKAVAGLDEVKRAKVSGKILIGHGSYDTVEYKFNLPGPDISGGELAALCDRVAAKRQLIVNTTPLGMFPNIDEKPDLNYNCLNENHVLFDLVYNPTLTSFQKMGKERGCKVIGGLEMLYLQAEKSWEIWNNTDV